MKDLLIIDFETSGIDPEDHIPLQLGAVLIDSVTLDIKETFCEYILPPYDREYIVTEEAYKIHGIDAYNMPKESLTQYECLKKFFTKFKRDSFHLAAWNVSFDVSFLKKMCYYYEFEFAFNVIDYHYFDVQSVCMFLKFLGVLKFDKISLNNVLAYFDISREKKHNALEDALFLYKLYKDLILNLEVSFLDQKNGIWNHFKFMDH